MNSTHLAVLKCNGEVSPPPSTHPPLRHSVQQALENYFYHLDGQYPVNLYKLVLQQIEAPLLEVVMNITKSNQSKAAELLGLSRSTLRKKLKEYKLDNA
jgi:Fis family transcriptional regulator